MHLTAFIPLLPCSFVMRVWVGDKNRQTDGYSEA